jgi:hypothetical protein
MLLVSVNNTSLRDAIMQKLLRGIDDGPYEIREQRKEPQRSGLAADGNVDEQREYRSDPGCEVANDGLFCRWRAFVVARGDEAQLPGFEGERASAFGPKVNEVRADRYEQIKLLKDEDRAAQNLWSSRAHRFARERGEDEAYDEQVGDKEEEFMHESAKATPESGGSERGGGRCCRMNGGFGAWLDHAAMLCRVAGGPHARDGAINISWPGGLSIAQQLEFNLCCDNSKLNTYSKLTRKSMIVNKKLGYADLVVKMMESWQHARKFVGT